MIGKISILVSLLSLMSMSSAQRPGYAGSQSYGYPVIIATTTPTTTSITTPAPSTDSLGNRLGEDVTNPPVTTTTQRLPIEAGGDRQLIEYFSKLPKDQQPFWFLNWQALEEQRKQPQTYPIHTNNYIDFASSGNRQPKMFEDTAFRTMLYSKK